MIEVGIIFLFDSEFFSNINEVLSNFPTSQLKNIPHISLYQLAIDKKCISKLCKIIENIKIPIFPFVFSINLELVGKNLFLRCAFPDEYKEQFSNFHKELVEEIRVYSAKPLNQVTDSFASFSKCEQERIRVYGVSWGIPGFFDPHVTILYDVAHCLNILPNIPKIKPYMPSHLAIGLLGYSGNVKENIYKKCL